MARDVLDAKILEKIQNHPKIKEKGMILQSIRNAISTIHKNKHITMNAAASEFAKANDFTVYKYLKEVDKKSLEKLIPTLGTATTYQKGRGSKGRREKSLLLTVEFPKGVKISDPVLPRVIINDASKMKDVYPKLYLFENSVRNLIKSVLENKYGKDWWDGDHVAAPVKRTVSGRMKKEKANRWHSKRGAHPIFYTDIGDLNSIISKNWKDFKDVIKKEQSWIKHKIEEIEFSRNVIAHNNPLSSDDIQRLDVNFKDWFKQIGSYQST